jgi:hypothetical protein
MTGAQAQTIRDRQNIEERIRKAMLFNQMAKCLSRWTKTMLLWEANTHYRKTIEAGHHIAKVGRVEHRRLDALYCWFCENHSEVLCGDFAVTEFNIPLRRGNAPCLSSVQADNQCDPFNVSNSLNDGWEWMLECDFP